MLLLLILARPALGQSKENKPPKFDETVEVTASRSEESITEAPVSISVVGQGQIQTSPADNYADLLRGVPGLNVVQTSARDIGIRGRGSAGVAEHRQLTLLDGRSIYLDFYGVVLWDFLPVNMDEIKQIEILRGPGSALWGPNALSGVINVRTKSPRELKGGSLMVGAGEIGTRTASLRWAEAFERFSYKASASYFEQHAWKRDDTLPDGSPLPVGYRFENQGTKQPKADLRFDWGTETSPLWSYKLGYGGTTGIFHSRLGPFRIEPGTHVGYGEVDRSSNLLDTKVYWNRLRGDAPNLVNGLDFSFDMDTYAGEVTARRPLGTNQVLVYGGSLRRTQFDLSLAPGGKARSEAGFFAEDSAVLHRNVSLSMGVRADYFNSIGTTLSPRTSVIFKVHPDHTIRIAYNRAYRAPSLVDNFLQTTIPNTISLTPTQRFVFQTRAAGNENLRAELVDALELGYTAVVARRALVTASLYRNDVRNNIVFVPTQFYSPSDPPAGWPGNPSTVPQFVLPKIFSFLNVGRVRDQGVELSWDMNWDDVVSTRAAYTYEHDPKIFNDRSTPLQVNRPPRNQVSVLANVRQPRWFASAGATYTDKAFWADVLDSRFWGTTRAYLNANAAVGLYANAATQISVKATDLLDRKIKEHVFGDVIRRKTTVELRYRF